MRDQVAAACQTSASKLARLKVIRENLAPELKGHWKKGALNESVAYTLAQQPAELQAAILRYNSLEKGGVDRWTEWSVKNDISKISEIKGRSCKKTKGPCDHAEAILTKMYENPYAYHPCTYCSCCDKCEKLVTCKDACPKLAEKIKALRLDRRARNQQEKEAQEEKDRPTIEKLAAYWGRFSEARTAAGKSVKSWFAHMEIYFNKDRSEKD